MKIKVNSPGGLREESVFAGYSDRHYSHVVLDRISNISLVYAIIGEDAYWGGGLYDTFYGRLSTANEGDTFKWGNRKFRRLTASELSELISNKVFQMKTPPLPPPFDKKATDSVKRPYKGSGRLVAASNDLFKGLIE